MTTTIQSLYQCQLEPLPPYVPERRKVPRLPGPARVHLQMAQWILARQMSDGQGMLSVADAAEVACRKLLDRLAKLITPSGCQALLLRALHLARTDFHFLRETEAGLTTGAYLEGVRKRAEGTDPGQVQRGLASLLGTLIELTALFVGEYLTGRLLLEVWPDLPVRELPQPGGSGR